MGAGGAPAGRILECFAEIFSYPAGPPVALADVVRAGETLVPPATDSGALLREFRRSVASLPLGRLQEIYTATFDLQPRCSPYVGYHLFGESYKRSVFLVGLQERYRQHGVCPDGELADHLSAVLRFLAACSDAAPAEELIAEALLPALDKMLEVSAATTEGGRRPRPYDYALRALRLVLRHRLAAAAAAEEEPA
ncbi:MAG: nitrate reductase molybdenum cofactor assembly chaperone [Candidatus Binatia bacterium]